MCAIIQCQNKIQDVAREQNNNEEAIDRYVWIQGLDDDHEDQHAICPYEDLER
jgi:hypothetical protein